MNHEHTGALLESVVKASICKSTIEVNRMHYSYDVNDCLYSTLIIHIDGDVSGTLKITGKTKEEIEFIMNIANIENKENELTRANRRIQSLEDRMKRLNKITKL